MSAKSTLLIQEPPLQVLPSLAVAIGLNEALIIQQLHYWLENPKVGVTRDGFKWIFNTYEEWQENFPFWSVSTIQRIFISLEKMSLVIAEQLESKNRDMRKFYRIDYDKLCAMQDSNLTPSNTPKSYDVKGTTETTKTEIDLDIPPVQKIEPAATEEPKPQDAVIKAMLSQGMFPDGLTADFLRTWHEKHTDERIIQALQLSKGKPQQYADKVLIGWEANGYPLSREDQIKAAKKVPQKSKQSLQDVQTQLQEILIQRGALVPNG